MPGLNASRSRAALRHLPLVGIVLAAAGICAFYALQATSWVVMTDELQTAKLATSIARTLSPAPQIHGEIYGSPSQLYPLLLAPFFGLLSPPAAVSAAHALNAVLLASAAWPAYLTARAVARSHAAGLFAAALTVFVPWLVLSTTLLTENAAYPAFVWAVWLAHRTISAPSRRADAAALAGLALAVLARTQLVVLAVALPLALLGHEVARALATAPRGRRLAAVREGARTAVASHPLLAGAYLAGVLAAGTIAAVGGWRKVLGTYEETVRGNLVPAGIWGAAAERLDYVAVAVGLVPFLLAASWALATAARPRPREAHAFAAILLVLVPLLTFQAASFDLRFTEGGFVQDRYLAYLAPLLAVGAAAALLDPASRALRAGLVLALAAAFAWLAGFASFAGEETIFWASPASAFHGALGTAAGWIDLSADSLVRWGALVVGALVAAVVWRAPARAALVGTGVVVAAFGIAELVYVFDRVALPVTTRPASIPAVERDWIDDAVPGGASVALVPNPFVRPDYWWEAELWNERVDRALRIGTGTTYTPFPAERLSIDPETGDVRGLEATRFLVVAQGETRIHFAHGTTVASAEPLNVVDVGVPARVDWATSGAFADGWGRPGRGVSLRVFAAGAPGWRDVDVTLVAPPGEGGLVHFSLRGAGGRQSALVARGGTRRLRVSVCAPERGFGQATLVSGRGVRIEDGRVVGVRVGRVEIRPTGRPCRPGAAPAA
jgi:hypothetical protein